MLVVSVLVDRSSCELILTIAHNIYASTVHGQSSSCHLLSRILKMVEKVLKPGVNRMMFLEHFLPQTQVRGHHGLYLHKADLEQELKQNYHKLGANSGHSHAWKNQFLMFIVQQSASNFWSVQDTRTGRTVSESRQTGAAEETHYRLLWAGELARKTHWKLDVFFTTGYKLSF